MSQKKFIEELVPCYRTQDNGPAKLSEYVDYTGVVGGAYRSKADALRAFRAKKAQSSR